MLLIFSQLEQNIAATFFVHFLVFFKVVVTTLGATTSKCYYYLFLSLSLACALVSFETVNIFDKCSLVKILVGSFVAFADKQNGTNNVTVSVCLTELVI
jgi:hypothetical protein